MLYKLISLKFDIYKCEIDTTSSIYFTINIVQNENEEQTSKHTFVKHISVYSNKNKAEIWNAVQHQQCERTLVRTKMIWYEYVYMETIIIIFFRYHIASIT